MQTEFIAIPPFWTVGQTIDYLRAEQDLPDEFFQIYVVDPGYSLLGTLALDKFLRAKRQVKIADLMNTNVIEVEATEDQEEAARIFERYDLVEVAVVDENRRLVGVLTIDDIVDVIHEEASEDIKRSPASATRRSPTMSPRPCAAASPGWWSTSSPPCSPRW
jgi:magnesium transporter